MGGEVDGELGGEGGAEDDLEHGEDGPRRGLRRREELRLHDVCEEAAEDEGGHHRLEGDVGVDGAEAGAQLRPRGGAVAVGGVGARGADGGDPVVALSLRRPAQVVGAAAVVPARRRSLRPLG